MYSVIFVAWCNGIFYSRKGIRIVPAARIAVIKPMKHRKGKTVRDKMRKHFKNSVQELSNE